MKKLSQVKVFKTHSKSDKNTEQSVTLDNNHPLFKLLNNGTLDYSIGLTESKPETILKKHIKEDQRDYDEKTDLMSLINKDNYMKVEDKLKNLIPQTPESKSQLMTSIGLEYDKSLKDDQIASRVAQSIQYQNQILTLLQADRLFHVKEKGTINSLKGTTEHPRLITLLHVMESAEQATLKEKAALTEAQAEQDALEEKAAAATKIQAHFKRYQARKVAKATLEKAQAEQVQ